MEEAVTFRNRNGRTLFGVVHVPEEGAARAPRVGVGILNPGIKYRVAPNRLNVKLARELCSRGYTVLRFDPEGIGDSEGELPEGMPVGDVWALIQRGRFVPDVQAANDFLLARHRLDRLLLMGNCGGAITALLAGAEDARVSGLCLVDVPVYLWSSERSIADTVVSGGERLDRMFKGYLKRLASPGSWYRFLTLQTDYASLARILRLRLGGLLPGKRGARLPGDLDEVCRTNRLNPAFFRSYQRFVARGGRVLFVLAGHDPGIDTFRKFFLDWYVEGQSGGGGDRAFEATVVENANHVYSLTEWQQQLVQGVVAWAERTARG